MRHHWQISKEVFGVHNINGRTDMLIWNQVKYMQAKQVGFSQLCTEFRVVATEMFAQSIGNHFIHINRNSSHDSP
ncbi:MAG: hypothetical protein BWY75_02789 [bacterium ADurb.Bin425]|nr:MAG: hypothetical protein BWY75_02789 [bacterium ADurb.Bin425]